ncbi:hypothetical protein BpHYR1_050404 [Brachionus plicatilis]|uniref:Uncharacterized protein n=1 Tax=Brachionus plicatilis TaxID=10195 RepID=A0A3M7SBP3_BRAPC|nr:hypothetical protein BpHYR1_050404 [Brachionus plicatilis]
MMTCSLASILAASLSDVSLNNCNNQIFVEIFLSISEYSEKTEVHFLNLVEHSQSILLGFRIRFMSHLLVILIINFLSVRRDKAYVDIKPFMQFLKFKISTVFEDWYKNKNTDYN